MIVQGTYKQLNFRQYHITSKLAQGANYIIAIV